MPGKHQLRAETWGETTIAYSSLFHLHYRGISQQPQQVCIGCSITWDSFISKHGKSFKTNLKWTKSRTSEAWSTYAGWWSISAGKSVVDFHLTEDMYHGEQRWPCCLEQTSSKKPYDASALLNTTPHHRGAPSAENSLKWRNANILWLVCIYLAICHCWCPWWLWYWRLTCKQCNFWVFWFYTTQLGSVWQNPKWMGLTLETNEKYPLASPQYCIMTHWLWLYVCSLQWNHWTASRYCTKFPCTKSLHGVL